MKVLVLDENKTNVDKIELLLTNSHKDISIFKYSTPFAFVTGIYDDLKGDVDLVLIYISDDCDERLKLARDVQEYFPHIKVIFYSEKMICAESIFVAKPSFFFKMQSDSSILLKALERVEEDIGYYDGNSLKIVSKGQIIKLRYETINYMESVGRKICIYSTSGNYETFSTMSEMMEQLPEYFFKCHRSYIVNLYKVTSISKSGLGLLEQQLIPVSREIKEELKEKLQHI